MPDVGYVARLVALATPAMMVGALTVPAAKEEPHSFFGDHVVERTHRDSKPGSAVFKDWTLKPLFDGGEEWRGVLGTHLVETLKAGDAMGSCKRFVSVGEYSWCMQAMTTVEDTTAQSQYPEHEYVQPKHMEERVSAAPASSLLALSYGVSSPDTWSEVMSNKFNVKTKLFDCSAEIPLGMHGVHSWKSPCTSTHCYNTEYEVVRTCVDDSTGVQGLFADRHGYRYQPLAAALEGRAPMSTFLKLDIAGSEWRTLDWLLDRDEELGKLRTLDVKVHPAMDVSVDEARLATEDSLRHHVKIMEKLSQKLAVVGSSLEGSLTSVRDELERNPRRSLREPFIYTQGGMPLEQFTVSYVNRELL